MERVDLAHEFGLRRVARWQTGSTQGSDCGYVTVGQLADGRWWADRTGQRDAVITGDQRAARRLAAQWRADGRDWRSVPAGYDAGGEPYGEGGPWRRSGGEWLPLREHRDDGDGQRRRRDEDGH